VDHADPVAFTNDERGGDERHGTYPGSGAKPATSANQRSSYGPLGTACAGTYAPDIGK
jgi:hypothetical protein